MIVRVLIVEDNPVSARYVQSAVEKSAIELSGGKIDYQFHCASTVDEACAVLGCAPQDVVILDLMLQATGGEQTFRGIHDHFPTVPIIVLTASNGDEMRNKYLALGAKELFSKGDLVTKSIAAIVVQLANEKKQ